MNDKTEIVELGVQYFEGMVKYELILSHNRVMDMYFCRVMKDDKDYGVVARYETKEQVMDWMRLILGDYPETHRGAA